MLRPTARNCGLGTRRGLGRSWFTFGLRRNFRKISLKKVQNQRVRQQAVAEESSSEADAVEELLGEAVNDEREKLRVGSPECSCQGGCRRRWAAAVLRPS